MPTMRSSSVALHKIRGQLWDAMHIPPWLSYSVLGLPSLMHPGDRQETDNSQNQHHILCTALSSR